MHEQFWLIFGQYLHPIPSADGNKVNWINYKTGVRYINFKMNGGKNSADIFIEISHPDAQQRLLYYEQFYALKKFFDESLEGIWQWEFDVINGSGKTVSRIHSQLINVNVLRKKDWPAIITFLKTGITGIDRFWVDYKELFIMM